MGITGMISTQSPGKNGKVWMFVEELGGGLVRIRAHNRECAHVIGPGPFCGDCVVRQLTISSRFVTAPQFASKRTPSRS